MNTFLYSEQIDGFESIADFGTTNIVEYLYIEDKTYVIDSSGNILLLNGGYTGLYAKECELIFVSNQDYQYTKTFDTAEVYFSNNNNNSTITSAFFYNSINTSNTSYSADFSNREGTQKLSLPRVGSGLYKDRLRDKYLVCDYKINRYAASNNYYFSLPYIKTKYRYSSI